MDEQSHIKFVKQKLHNRRKFQENKPKWCLQPKEEEKAQDSKAPSSTWTFSVVRELNPHWETYLDVRIQSVNTGKCSTLENLGKGFMHCSFPP